MSSTVVLGGRMSELSRTLPGPIAGGAVPPLDPAALAGCPVHRIDSSGDHAVWLVTGHQEIRQVLSNPAFSRAAAIDPEHPDPDVDTSLLGMDPPEHTRLRTLVARAFSARRVATLRAGTRRTAEQLLDRLAAGGAPADLVPAFCLALPIQVICELLGVPVRDQATFCAWSGQLLSIAPGERDAADTALRGYMAALIAAKRRAPGDDLLSELITARDVHDRLTEDELVELGVGILVGGHETTATQLANFSHLLLTDPRLAGRLRAGPGHIPAAVEEMLRLMPLGGEFGGTTPRVALHDTTLGGVTVRAGDALIGATAIANRSPRVYAEPDELRLDRETSPHLTFGHGAHHCLGSQLARMELQVGLAALLTRFPGLRLAVADADLEWRTDGPSRAPRRLPVAW